ncbi:serine hydrolase domain-containing protein [uncultured Pseudokineococcus sp.]|uniref:serine hydrolase domain-containing protein n=1 Tax=uncultured Pseudokineococcus sp. TaxID=1642928 RepID=UPI00260656F9|nr:serine hydrolase domain-containing protein [uncultured Pseudokineococcus sp.]
MSRPLAVRRGRRAAVLGTVLACALVLPSTAVAAAPAPGAGDVGGEAPAGRFDVPLAGFLPPTSLRRGAPEEVGLDPAPLRDALAEVAEHSADGPADARLYPGSVALVGHRGVVVAEEAHGLAVQYAGEPGATTATELPGSEQVPVTTATRFDMASVSKLFTSIAVMQQVEAGRVDLDARVVRYLPEFEVGGEAKSRVTVRQLLTHTAGFAPFVPLWSLYPDRDSRVRGALQQPLQSEPGTAYVYSDLSMISLGALVEEVTGERLDTVVRDGITAPLGMDDTGYATPGAPVEGAAATELQVVPPRGVVRGEVHDENAWSLDGVAGHAGVFSTAEDMARLAQALLSGGVAGDGTRVLRESSVRRLVTDENTEFPGDAHGLGFELDQRWYMDGLSSARTAGHTGFTGTSLVLDLASGSFAVLLTNRVHPSRDGGSVNPARRALARGLAQALRVPPRVGDDAWSTQPVDATTQVLATAVDSPPRGAVLSFAALVDVEATDPLVVESSADGGVTWQRVPLRARTAPEQGVVGRVVHARDGALAAHGHRTWWDVTGRLPAGPSDGDLLVRWRYTTDALYQGRGVVVDDVRVEARGDVLLDAEADPGALVADGWVRTG